MKKFTIIKAFILFCLACFFLISPFLIRNSCSEDINDLIVAMGGKAMPIVGTTGMSWEAIEGNNAYSLKDEYYGNTSVSSMGEVPEEVWDCRKRTNRPTSP